MSFICCKSVSRAFTLYKSYQCHDERNILGRIVPKVTDPYHIGPAYSKFPAPTQPNGLASVGHTDLEAVALAQGAVARLAFFVVPRTLVAVARPTSVVSEPRPLAVAGAEVASAQILFALGPAHLTRSQKWVQAQLELFSQRALLRMLR